MKFSDIHGLEEEKQQFTQAVDGGHIPHAQLFVGPAGSAKLAMALAYATYLNCSKPEGGDACGTCANCQQMAKLVHPDVHFVFPVSSIKGLSGKDVISSSFLPQWREWLLQNPYGNANDWSEAFGGENKQLNISKEESRHIIRNLSLMAFGTGYKVMIIWLPEFMHSSAANGILKILEEPPKRTVFLLVSESPDQLLGTITSRTQRFTIRAFSDDEIVAQLQARGVADEARARQVAHLAEGNLREALMLVNEVEDDSHKMFRDWMRECYQWNLTQMVSRAEDFQKLRKVSQQTLMQYGLNMMRETLLAHYSGHGLERLQGDEASFVGNFSKVVSPEKVEHVNHALNTAMRHLERNANPKILFLDLSLSMARLLRS